MEGQPSSQRPMTCCECAGLSFEEIARRLAEPGRSLEQMQQATGCGLLCTACVPDLDRLVARLRADSRQGSTPANDPRSRLAGPAEPR
jgi:bacterioferritin-associated ferredoxin